MSIISRLFGNRTLQQSQEPDNDQLILLLNKWSENRSTANLEAVLSEFYSKNTFLLIPVADGNSDTAGWDTLKTDISLQLTSVIAVEGLKVLAAFTNYDALKRWAQNGSGYVTLLTKDVLKHCQVNGIDKIIVNKNSTTEFELERSNKNIKATVIKKGSEVLIGPAEKTLDEKIIEQLTLSFRKVETIIEAYQYEICINDEYLLVLGILLSPDTESTRTALRNAINNALFQQVLANPIDVIVLENEQMLSKVRRIQNSLFYKK